MWPLMVHLTSACICLGSSALYHLMYVRSEKMMKLLARLDYGGISILIAGSSYPPIYYSFACQPVHSTRLILIALISTTSALCFILTMIPAFDTAKFRPVRGIMFVLLGISAAIPFISFYVKKPTR